MRVDKEIKDYFLDIFSILDNKAKLSDLLNQEELTRQEVYDWLSDTFDDWDFGEPCSIKEIPDINFTFARGETKLVITIDDYRPIKTKFDGKFVIKIPFTDGSLDYCLREEKISEKVVDIDYLKQFFALCFFAFEFYDKKVYVMERVEVDEFEEKGASRLMAYDREIMKQEGRTEEEIEESLEKNRGFYYSSGIDVTSEIIKISYSSCDVEELEVFMKNNKINDIHRQNIGFIGERPVIIDYSGYFEGFCSYYSEECIY